MPNHNYVMCRDARSMTLAQVGEFIADGSLLDEAPVFEPPLASAALTPNLTSLSFRYRAEKRPVVIVRLTELDEIAEVVAEAIATLREHQIDRTELVARLSETRQIFHFELGLELTDDCWEALDATECYVAKLLDGVVFAAGGFYDRNLKAIVTW